MNEADSVRVDLAAYASAVPDAVIEQLRSARHAMVICHENPEADALGSALAISMLVEAGGGSATPICTDPMPQPYKFLAGMERFRQQPDPTVSYDLIVVADCGELERVGPVLVENADLFRRIPILDVDHHLSNTHFGALDWVDPASSATCEMVALLAWRMGVPLDSGDGSLAARARNGSCRCRALSVLQSLRHLTYWAHVQRTPFLPILATVVCLLQHIVGCLHRG